ncbi:MAG: GGDEF domain-containing protein [Myxococcota bacterium]|nr:GGDEF domain-containing protein [Myxococcota bacterium]
MVDSEHPPALEDTQEFLLRRGKEYRQTRVLVAGALPAALSKPAVVQDFGFEVEPDPVASAALLRDKGYQVVLVPLAADSQAAIALLEQLSQVQPGAVKIALGSPANPEGIFEAVQRGLVDHLLPGDTGRAELEIALAAALERAVRDAASTGLLTDLSKDCEDLRRRMEAQSQALFEARSRLDRMSVSDPTTGLYSHSYFSSTWRREMARATRYGRALSLMLLDVDRKDGEDEVKGEILLGCGSFLLDSIRDVDFVARFRQEGFAVILPECSKADAQDLAERLRKRFEDSGAGALEGRSVTIALAACPEDESSGPAMIERADRALREAMASGSNRVVAG